MIGNQLRTSGIFDKVDRLLSFILNGGKEGGRGVRGGEGEEGGEGGEGGRGGREGGIKKGRMEGREESISVVSFLFRQEALALQELCAQTCTAHYR